MEQEYTIAQFVEDLRGRNELCATVADRTMELLRRTESDAVINNYLKMPATAQVVIMANLAISLLGSRGELTREEAASLEVDIASLAQERGLMPS